LIVDDEETIVELVKHYLVREGFAVEEAADGRAGLEKWQALDPAVVILDLMLPGMSGTDLCREIRKTSTVPIMMLTAKDDLIDKVVGFELGADDYVTKPFEPKELVARVKALQRRGAEAQAAPPSTLSFQDIAIDPDRREVRIKGQQVDLRPKEFDLLVALARHPGQVFSREQLLNSVWGYDFEGYSRTVDVHVQHLRDKIAAVGGPPCIHTVWGVGYKFQAP
jgi:DNA-binding response OmpR family regulator